MNNHSLIHAVPQTAAVAVAPDDAASEFCWYAVSTKSRHEKIVAQQFVAKQIEHFLPLAPFRRRWSNRYKTVYEPLFAGYVLVRLVHADYAQRVAVLDCRGVAKFVGNGAVAWPVPDREVDSVRIVVQSRLEYSPYPYLQKGTLVEVVHGPLIRACGILIIEPRKHRLVVSIPMMSQSVAVDIDVADVRPC